MRPFAQRIWERTAEEVSTQAKEGAHVVDLGCGPATLLRLVRSMRSDLELTGVDIDPRVLSIAEQNSEGRSIRFRNASITALPCENDSVDVALTSFVYPHLSHGAKRQALREVRRVLKSNGAFLLCDFAESGRSWQSRIASLFRMVTPNIIPQLAGELESLLRETGAKVRTLQRFYGCITLSLIRFPIQE